jgi:hypothetical protein
MATGEKHSIHHIKVDGIPGPGMEELPGPHHLRIRGTTTPIGAEEAPDADDVGQPRRETPRVQTTSRQHQVVPSRGMA